MLNITRQGRKLIRLWSLPRLFHICRTTTVCKLLMIYHSLTHVMMENVQLFFWCKFLLTTDYCWCSVHVGRRCLRHKERRDWRGRRHFGYQGFFGRLRGWGRLLSRGVHRHNGGRREARPGGGGRHCLHAGNCLLADNGRIAYHTDLCGLSSFLWSVYHASVVLHLHRRRRVSEPLWVAIPEGMRICYLSAIRFGLIFNRKSQSRSTLMWPPSTVTLTVLMTAFHFFPSLSLKSEKRRKITTLFTMCQPLRTTALDREEERNGNWICKFCNINSY